MQTPTYQQISYANDPYYCYSLTKDALYSTAAPYHHPATIYPTSTAAIPSNQPIINQSNSSDPASTIAYNLTAYNQQATNDVKRTSSQSNESQPQLSTTPTVAGAATNDDQTQPSIVGNSSASSPSDEKQPIDSQSQELANQQEYGNDDKRRDSNSVRNKSNNISVFFFLFGKIYFRVHDDGKLMIT